MASDKEIASVRAIHDRAKTMAREWMRGISPADRKKMWDGIVERGMPGSDLFVIYQLAQIGWVDTYLSLADEKAAEKLEESDAG